jgi:rhodanese-related sulfurtransferase
MAEKTMDAVKEITRDSVKERIDQRDRRHTIVIETLPPEQFQHAHLPGAVNMPPDRVRELAPTLVADKQAEIITYCAGPTCHASLGAARLLSALGYTNVWHYAGGKQDWIAAGFPFERGE